MLIRSVRLILSVCAESSHNEIWKLFPRFEFWEFQHLSSPALVVENVFDFACQSR